MKAQFFGGLGRLDSDLKNELLCPPPLDFWGKVKKNSFFSKWPPSVAVEHEIFFCGAILTNKISILTNSSMGILFVTFVFTISTFLTLKLKMATVNNAIRKQF